MVPSALLGPLVLQAQRVQMVPRAPLGQWAQLARTVLQGRLALRAQRVQTALQAPLGLPGPLGPHPP